MTPIDVKKKNDNLLAIVWDDGHESVYKIDFLRKCCPCATCRNTTSTINPVTIQTSKDIIPENIQIKEAQVVGRYALQFTWSDGHHEGIYSFDYLRQQCQCDICEK